MSPDSLAKQLKISGEILSRQLEEIDAGQARWKPNPKKWSILEVLVHLVEEEQFDFRPRLVSTLEDPDRPWPPINPEGWVSERRYNECDPTKMLTTFQIERSDSLDWLHGLKSPKWDNTYHHPMGEIRAGDLTVSWLTHDQLHIRQIANLKALWLAEHSAPYSTHYAAP